MAIFVSPFETKQRKSVKQCKWRKCLLNESSIEYWMIIIWIWTIEHYYKWNSFHIISKMCSRVTMVTDTSHSNEHISVPHKIADINEFTWNSGKSHSPNCSRTFCWISLGFDQIHIIRTDMDGQILSFLFVRFDHMSGIGFVSFSFVLVLCVCLE